MKQQNLFKYFFVTTFICTYTQYIAIIFKNGERATIN